MREGEEYKTPCYASAAALYNNRLPYSRYFGLLVDIAARNIPLYYII